MVFTTFVFSLALGGVDHDEAARYFKMRAYAEAERRYGVLVATNSSDVVAALGLADAIAKQGDWERAAASYQAFVDAVARLPAKSHAAHEANVARALNSIGVVAASLNRLEDAEKAFTRAVYLAPKVGLYIANLAYVIQLNSWTHSTAELRSPDGGAASRLARLFANVGAGDPARPLVRLWTDDLSPSKTLQRPSFRSFVRCKAPGEPRTAGRDGAVLSILEKEHPQFADALDKPDSPYTISVCERDAIEIDIVVSTGQGRVAAVFASAPSWSEIGPALTALVKKATALAKQRN
ncbi:MAG: tetratricopeptide repeat protein [Deltaproteobacteria bacterium]|nr:tetratricopeptide repeat protein [Deltaproteobacteria bacterium]